MFDSATSLTERPNSELSTGVETTAPGPELARLLADTNIETLSGHERVSLLKAYARQVAHDQAGFYRAIESVHESIRDTYPDQGLDLQIDTTASEIRAALRLTRRAADTQLDIAIDLCARLPEVFEALSAGNIDLARARVLIDNTCHLPETTARSVAATVLEQAPGLTTGQLRATIAKQCILADPDTAQKRYDQGLQERRLVVNRTEDGTANLLALSLPAEKTHAAMHRINRIARSLKTRDDSRSIDQIRADIFLDLLNGKTTNRQTGRALSNGHDRGVVDIRVDLTTLAGLDENPAEIPGWGPVIADIARQVTEFQANSQWQATVTDSQGHPIHTITTRRRPSNQQKRVVRTRNPTCVFPGCRMPSANTDLDHHHPWAENGSTSEPNLGPLCRHDHNLKHHNNWKLKPLGRGAYQWTSPLGHVYVTGPDPP